MYKQLASTDPIPYVTLFHFNLFVLPQVDKLSHSAVLFEYLHALIREVHLSTLTGGFQGGRMCRNSPFLQCGFFALRGHKKQWSQCV